MNSSADRQPAAKKHSVRAMCAVVIVSALSGGSSALAADYIDNGVFGDGRWRAYVSSGGDTNTLDIDPPGALGMADMMGELTTYFDIGADGGAVLLSSSAQGGSTIEPATNCVRTNGSFVGSNGVIDWTARGCLPFGAQRYNVTLQFASLQPFGRVRMVNMLNETILNNGNDDFIGVFGTPGTQGFRILSIDQNELVGFTRGLGTLNNSSFVGWAAAISGTLAGRILAQAPLQFTLSGNIDTNQIPQVADPRYPGVRMYGKRDNATNPAAAFAFDLAENATSATYAFFINGEITPSDVIFANGFE